MMNVLFPWKIGPLEFWGRSLALVSIGTVSDWLTDRPEVSEYWVWAWFTLYCVYGVIEIMLPRARDVGFSPARLLLLLVPFVNMGICMVLGFFPTKKPEETNAQPAGTDNDRASPSRV